MRANIAFGIPEKQISDSQVERAARIANIHDFVTGELTDGYNTVVEERGVRLSGGRRPAPAPFQSLTRGRSWGGEQFATSGRVRNDRGEL